MNGKIKTKFAALFAVALMITVCVVPVVDNAGVDAAPVSSSNGEVFEGYDITLFKVGDDYSDLIYRGAQPVGVAGATQSGSTGYWIDEDGKYITVGQVSGYIDADGKVKDYVVNTDYYGLPLIQVVYGYADAFNPITLSVQVEYGTAAPVKFDNFTQNNTGKSQGMFHIQMGKFNDAGNAVGASTVLNLNPEQIAGDFKVSLTGTQGFETETVSKTVNAGPAVTISGNVTDFDGKAIKGAKIFLNNNTTTPAGKTDKNGKYSFNVVAKETYAIVVSAEGYTFTQASWDFGDVNSSVTKDFKANEKTGTITVQSKTGSMITGATITGDWYYQYSTTTGTPAVKTYNISTSVPTSNGITDGSFELLGASTVDGKISFTYKVPTGTFTPTANSTMADYAYALVISASGPTGYTYDTVTPGNSTEKALSAQINEKAGTVDAQNGSGTIVAKESTGSITVQSANGNPIIGAQVELDWVYQYTRAQIDSNQVFGSKVYIIDKSVPTSEGITDGSVEVLSTDDKTDMDGKVYFSYVAPTGTFSKTDSSGQYQYGDYDYVLLATTGTGTDGINKSAGYSFEVDTISYNGQASDKSIFTYINENGGLADAKSGSATLTSITKSYQISGNVEGIDAQAPISEGVVFVASKTTKIDVPVSEKGAYSFYVIEGDIVVVSLGTGITSTNYQKSSFDLGTIEQNKTADFKLNISTAATAAAVYKVIIEDDVDATVDFTYSINGSKFTTSVDVEDGADASLTICGYVGDDVQVSASVKADDYTFEVSEFDKYSAYAIQYASMYVQTVVDEVPYAGAEFQAVYEYDDEIVTLDFKSDDNGFVVITAPTHIENSSFKYVKGHKVLDNPVPGTGYYEGIEAYVTLDLSEIYGAKKVGVAISYMSAYNSDTVLFAPVADAEIALGKTVAADVGDSIALKAPSIDNFEFVAWMVDGVVVSEKADYTLDVDGDCQVVALYSAVHYEEPAEGLSMNVLVIGIVILILGILAVAYGIISKKQ